MRYVWITFLSLTTLLLGGLLWPRHRAVPTPVAAPAPPAFAVPTTHRVAHPLPPDDRAEALTRFALAQLGTRYCYAGTTPASGFDCSGFVRYVFAQFSIDVPHSTTALIQVGQPVPRAQARPGDIVVFTGTSSTSTTPGHAGIVLSEPGEVLRFVHASSARRESGVKVSNVEGTGYESRFMQVRRVL